MTPKDYFPLKKQYNVDFTSTQKLTDAYIRTVDFMQWEI